MTTELPKLPDDLDVTKIEKQNDAKLPESKNIPIGLSPIN